MRLAAVADSDSYLKWGAALLGRAPAEWATSVSLLATPVTPSAQQIRTALAGTGIDPVDVPRLELGDLVAKIASDDPDVVLLAVRGPVVRVLVRALVASAARRPVLISGLPGIAVPVTRKALSYRSQVDLVMLHSRREVRDFEILAAEMGIEQSFALGRLPFLVPRARKTVASALAGSPAAAQTVAAQPRDLVFAAQAKVPREPHDRLRLLTALAAAAESDPRRRVVVKVRATGSEQQTHAERYPYDELLASMQRVPENLVVENGPMSASLDAASAVVTVSSTAAVEAVAMGLPVILLDDFGVGPETINVVFEGSGLFGSLQDVVDGRFRRPAPDWIADNYLHDADLDDWASAIQLLAERRRVAPLPLRPQHRGRFGGELRRIWDRKQALGSLDRSPAGYLALAIGIPMRGLVRLWRRRMRDIRRLVAGATA